MGGVQGALLCKQSAKASVKAGRATVNYLYPPPLFKGPGVSLFVCVLLACACRPSRPLPLFSLLLMHSLLSSS